MRFVIDLAHGVVYDNSRRAEALHDSESSRVHALGLFLVLVLVVVCSVSWATSGTYACARDPTLASRPRRQNRIVTALGVTLWDIYAQAGGHTWAHPRARDARVLVKLFTQRNKNHPIYMVTSFSLQYKLLDRVLKCCSIDKCTKDRRKHTLTYGCWGVLV